MRSNDFSVNSFCDSFSLSTQLLINHSLVSAAFGQEYTARNPHRKEIASPEAAAYLANSLLAINNAHHNRVSVRFSVSLLDSYRFRLIITII